MSPTRHYFTKAVAPPAKVRVVRPDHKGQIVMAVLANGAHVAMSSRDAASQMGCSKGGATTQARGTANRFTSETARKAALKCWATRWRKVRGIRIGRPAKKRPSVDRVALRAQHQKADGDPYGGVQFHYGYRPMLDCWTEVGPNGPRVINEVTALRKLGHLEYPRRGVVPVKVVAVVNGRGLRKGQTK